MKNQNALDIYIHIRSYSTINMLQISELKSTQELKKLPILKYELLFSMPF